MIKSQLILILIALSSSLSHAANWQDAQWIWESTDGTANTWMAFRKEINLADVPETAIANIGVDSKYWLWINGQMVKFEGGSARGPAPGNTWYDEVDIKPYLTQGTNTIAILAWYWGRETFKGTHIDSKKGGVIFQAKLGDLEVKTDDTWTAKRHTAYDANSGGGNNRIVPYNIHFDANKSMGDWSSSAWYTSGYDDSSWGTAVAKGAHQTAPWGELEQSYVTLKDYGLADYVSLMKGSSAVTLPYTNTTGATITIEAKLPFNKQITPYLDINSGANKTIAISTNNDLNTITVQYISKAGDQQFEAYSWMSGSVLKYEIPAGVTVNALKYRWTGVGELVGDFECSDGFYERLWWMGRNTLYVNARDNFMDCPDRERSLWIGDVSDQASYLFYTLGEEGRDLLKKAINITVDFSIDGKVIAGQGPGFVNELPSQSLQFVSQGIWQYYLHTGDTVTLDHSYSLVKNYLNLWRFDNTKNLIIMKSCTHDKCWDWCDWDSGKTTDKLPIFNALYYYALTSAKKMAEALEKPQADIGWYNNRIDKLKVGFNDHYWKGEFYASDASKYQDDRTNALAIITGLADESKHQSIVENVLVPNHFCSPHFEWMIEEAMCIAGYHTEALVRMRKRYTPQVINENTTTLNEYFTIGEGTDNHAWNAPNTILSKHIAGISPINVGWKKYRIAPHLTRLTALKQIVPSVKGNIVVDINLGDAQYQMDLTSPSGSVALVGIPKASIAPTEIKVNGTLIWEAGSFVEDLSNATAQSEDDDFIWFELNAGTWSVVASGLVTIPNYVEYINLSNGDAIDAGANLIVRAEAGSSTAKVDLYLNETLVRSISETPYVWGLDPLEDASLASMAVGGYTLKLVAIDEELDSVVASLLMEVEDTAKQTSFAGIIPIPGTLEAENYDEGGEGKSYHDDEVTNKGDVYRTDGVDIGPLADGQYNIGWTANGEWLEYTVDVAQTGMYDISIVYAAGRTTPAKISLELFDEGKVLVNQFTLPLTANWDSYETITKENVPLSEGTHILRLNILLSGCNIDKLIFEQAATSAMPTDDALTFNVYPNPSEDGIFYIVASQSWEVYNISGVKIVSGVGTEINLSPVTKGVYLLNVNKQVEKLVVL